MKAVLKHFKKDIQEFIVGMHECYETFDIDSLLDKLDIKVSYFDRDELGLDTDGIAYGRTIEINKDLTGDYLEFIKCHELGHIILHGHLIQLLPLNHGDSSLKLEREANDFALALLALAHDMEVETLRLKLADIYKVYV